MSQPQPSAGSESRKRTRMRAARKHSGELRMLLGAVVAGWLTFRVIVAVQEGHAWWRIVMAVVAIVAGLVLAVDGYRIRARARARRAERGPA
jgi:nicotinamide riboside transporter PnuC